MRSRLFPFVLAYSSIAVTAVAHERTRCDSVLLQVAEIEVTQKNLRYGDEYVKRIQLHIQKHGSLSSPIVLVRFEDGRIFVHDGHHRFAAVTREGLTHLRAGVDYVIRDYTYAQFLEVNFNAGWMTPFDPRTHVRLGEFAGYKALVSHLRDKAGDTVAEDFVRRHPEAYSARRTGPEKVSSFEGSDRDRIAYFEAMNRSMPMKLGHLLGGFPSSGILWEPGTGSGAQACGYAHYYPELLVVGTDLDHQSVAHAQSHFAFPNLVFMQGDALVPDFPSSFFDAIEDSSTGHHLVSYGKTGNDFKESNIEAYREHVVDKLRPGGHYAMRDFVTPDWPAEVRLHLSTKPGSGEGFAALSKAELFEDFARRFRSHDYPRGVRVSREVGPDGMVSFVAPGEFVANFMLRIEYTKNWDAELKEQYTYYSQREHVESLQRRGLRVDFAQPFQNPWIEKEWWSPGVVRVESLDGKPLDLPAANLIIYARKLKHFEVRRLGLKRVQPIDARDSWMKLSRFERQHGGDTDVRELIRVPGITQSFVPYESSAEGNFLYINTDVERPALVYYNQLSSVDQTAYSGITSGGFSRVFADGATDPVAAFAQTLEEKALTTLDARSRSLIDVQKSFDFIPSPGTSDELVGLYMVDMRGEGHHNVFREGSSKRVEINQFLSATLLGAIPSGRLQVAAYQLAREKSWPLTPWFSGPFTARDQTERRVTIEPTYAALSGRVSSAGGWQMVDANVSASRYLNLEKVDYERVREDGQVELRHYEFGRPSARSVNTVSAIPYFVSGGELYVGFENYASPAFERRGFGGAQPVVPALRLSLEARDRHDLVREASAHLERHFGLRGDLQVLGEGYFPSPGQIPEKVLPYAVEVDATQPLKGLIFVPWSTLKNELHRVHDLHTLVSVNRLAHALGRF